jgi:hypothetical protein
MTLLGIPRTCRCAASLCACSILATLAGCTGSSPPSSHRASGLPADAAEAAAQQRFSHLLQAAPASAHPAATAHQGCLQMQEKQQQQQQQQQQQHSNDSATYCKLHQQQPTQQPQHIRVACSSSTSSTSDNEWVTSMHRFDNVCVNPACL